MKQQNQPRVEKPIRSLPEALDYCRKSGMRISRQRQLILELLWRSQKHLSAREIYDRLNQQNKQICQTSVYQNLAALSQHGIIECLERSEGNLYGSLTDSHSHVNCLDSDRIFNVWVQLPNNLVEQVERQTNTKIVDYRIEFYGYRR